MLKNKKLLIFPITAAIAITVLLVLTIANDADAQYSFSKPQIDVTVTPVAPGTTEVVFEVCNVDDAEEVVLTFYADIFTPDPVFVLNDPVEANGCSHEVLPVPTGLLDFYNVYATVETLPAGNREFVFIFLDEEQEMTPYQRYALFEYYQSYYAEKLRDEALATREKITEINSQIGDIKYQELPAIKDTDGLHELALFSNQDKINALENRIIQLEADVELLKLSSGG